MFCCACYPHWDDWAAMMRDNNNGRLFLFTKYLLVYYYSYHLKKTSRPRRAHHDIHALQGGGVEDPYLKKALAYPFQTI